VDLRLWEQSPQWTEVRGYYPVKFFSKFNQSINILVFSIRLEAHAQQHVTIQLKTMKIKIRRFKEKKENLICDKYSIWYV